MQSNESIHRLFIAFSALTVLVGRQKKHIARKHIRRRRGYLWSEMQIVCIRSADDTDPKPVTPH